MHDFNFPLASLPDGALTLLLSFTFVTDLFAINHVCKGWTVSGDRIDLWKALGQTFEVAMPPSLGPNISAVVSGIGGCNGGRRRLRSADNARRTFYKSYGSALKVFGYKHDQLLSEAYTLFRTADSTRHLRTLLRRRWGRPSDSPKKRACFGESGSGSRVSPGQECSLSGTSKPLVSRCSPSFSDASAWALTYLTRGRWSFNVNHRHSILEGNTMLNFAVRCGRRKCVAFIIQMGGDVEIPDDGGFTPLLNAAWRGDVPLLKQLLDAGASTRVKGISRGQGPYSPLEWAERKDRFEAIKVLRSIADGEQKAQD